MARMVLAVTLVFVEGVVKEAFQVTVENAEFRRKGPQR